MCPCLTSCFLVLSLEVLESYDLAFYSQTNIKGKQKASSCSIEMLITMIFFNICGSPLKSSFRCTHRGAT
ncbi:hypothetical protein KP509_06G089700 [Ceratopteris richardii]|uniref:Secreted protein n=1 Tax=Ceratopteris richardii TaxID=49495 RepID=A0A8T2UMR2_CERRI|nr:hypothetical protein KP509_06G089700 [Ceratopteris richardii]